MRIKQSTWLLAVAYLICGTHTDCSHAAVRLTVRITPAKSPQNGQDFRSVPGQSATLLPNGQWLLMGGEGPEGPLATILVRDPQTGTTSQLESKLQTARAWHTATLLPDGTVFIFGGLGADKSLVRSAEVFDPVTQTSELVVHSGISPRAHHTATLLTPGVVLIAGGTGSDGETTGSMQLWDPKTGIGQASATDMLVARSDHVASLNPDGTVLLWGGLSRNGATLSFGEVFDPLLLRARIETNPSVLSSTSAVPFVEASLPADNSLDVPSDTRIAVRFSKALAVQTVNPNAFRLSGPDGAVDSKVIPAEGGMLAFITPAASLSQGATYKLELSGAQDALGIEVAQAIIVFTTGTSSGGVVGAPGSAGNDNDSGQLDDHFHRLPPLQAKAGVTALSGQVLKLNATPLRHVLLQIDDKKAFTDETGRFLLTDITPGHHVMLIDGTNANHDEVQYGIYEDGVDITGKQTNVLNYTVWMTALDTAHEVTIPSPTTSEVVVTTSSLPGLELHLPANTVIRDRNGKIVTTLSITPIPINQPPFPLPRGVEVPIYFTIQPGAAYLEVGSNPQWQKGARLIYPNSFHYPPGTIFDFWNYNADAKGWFIYGHGKVSQDAKSIIPDPGVEIYEFTGAMVGSPGGAPGAGGSAGDGSSGGDPVNLSTGLFVYNKTDLVLPDVIPLTLARTYRPNDNQQRAFGIGTTSSYEMLIVGDTNPYTYQDLILPDGSRIHFYRTSSGTSYSDAVYAHTSSKTNWYGATITYNTSAFPGASWILTTKDRRTYYFPDGFGQTNPAKMALLGIRDRYGNTVTITRDSNGNVTKITSPNGRYIAVQHDTNNRITQAQDNIGRTVQYQYDAVGRIQQVTDAGGGIWQYTYDSNNNMLTIQDARGILYLTNQYDSGNHVIKQTQADNSTYQFAWTFTSNTVQPPYAVMGSGSPGGSATAVMTFRNCTTCSEGYQPLVTKVDITDPNGNVRRVQFNSTGYTTSDTYALGKPEQQAFSYSYFADNLLQSVTDPLGRITTYTYDANGNVTSVTRLSGTSNAVTTNTVYDGTFNQILSVTDPLNHTVNLSYDALGNLSTVTDPLGHQTSFTYDTEGHVASAVDPLNNVTNFSYYLSDLASVINPLSQTTTRFVDAAGRLIAITDTTGKTSRFAYNALNQITTQTDSLGNQTSFSYDPNGNLLSVTDANNHLTQYTYSNMDRLATRKDPLLNQESYQYDGNGNLTQFTDRRGKVTTYSYDSLNRRTFAGFGTQAGPTYESTVSYTYDGGNRLTQVVDSISGTITRGYDGLNRLSSDATPQGTIGYTYDVAGRRSSLTVPGQGVVNYTFDNANRLTQITQGSTTVSFSYDNSNRRTTLTLPNGITTSYNYDNASQLTGLTYAKGSNTLGNLTYGYDLVGRRVSVGGTYAQSNLPLAISTTAYNANNQLTTWGTANLFYDLNGNMTSDGTHSYAWDARNHMKQIDSGTTASFAYDPLGRRISKNILGTTTSFLYDSANAVQEVIGGTNTANSLIGGIDEVFQRTDSSGARSFLADALGSSITLADSAGTIQTQYSFDPFGITTASGASTTNSFAYTGRELDGTGLYFNRARYYNPQLQRFISEDPAGFLGGINRYSYVLNNPTNLRDPLGLWGGGVTSGFTSMGGLGGGTTAGGTVSVGGVYFADPSNPLGFTSTGFISQGGYAGNGVGNWGVPSDAGNVGGGFGAGFGIGAIFTNGNSANDLAGPFTNNTLILPFVTIDYAKGANGIFTFSATLGPGTGVGFFHYCTNTWTSEVSSESFSHPGTPTGRNCGCNTGP